MTCGHRVRGHTLTGHREFSRPDTFADTDSTETALDGVEADQKLLHNWPRMMETDSECTCTDSRSGQTDVPLGDTCTQRELQSHVIKGSMAAVGRMFELGLPWQADLCGEKESPLHASLKQQNMEMVKKLSTISNLVHVPNAFGETPMHLACRLGLKDAVQLLLDAGAKVNVQDCEENMPLYHAVAGKSPNCVQLMINAGCDLDSLNRELMAAMDLALLYRQHTIIAQLLIGGCNVEKLTGHIYYRDHCANDFFYSLWRDSTIGNMRLFFYCGYSLGRSQMQSLKAVCHQLRGNELELYELLRDLSERPQSLTQLCRRQLRQKLMEMRQISNSPMDAMIDSLPVPQSVKGFLAIKEFKETQAMSSS